MQWLLIETKDGRLQQLSVTECESMFLLMVLQLRSTLQDNTPGYMAAHNKQSAIRNHHTPRSHKICEVSCALLHNHQLQLTKHKSLDTLCAPAQPPQSRPACLPCIME